MSLNHKFISFIDNSFWLVGERDGKAIARSKFIIRGQVGEIMDLHINQEERRKGHGTKMISLIENKMKQMGCIMSLLSAYPYKGNMSDRNLYLFYQKSGYRHFN